MGGACYWGCCCVLWRSVAVEADVLSRRQAKPQVIYQAQMNLLLFVHTEKSAPAAVHCYIQQYDSRWIDEKEV